MEITKMILCKEVSKDIKGQYQPLDPIFKIEEIFYPNKIEKCSLIMEAKSKDISKISLIIDSPKGNITEQLIDVIPDIQGRWVKIIILDGLPLEEVGVYSIKVKNHEKILKDINFKAEYIESNNFTKEEKLKILNDATLISEAGRTILSGVTKKKYNIYMSLDDAKEPPKGYIKMPANGKLIEENGNILDLNGLKGEMESKFGEPKEYEANGIKFSFTN